MSINSEHFDEDIETQEAVYEEICEVNEELDVGAVIQDVRVLFESMGITNLYCLNRHEKIMGDIICVTLDGRSVGIEVITNQSGGKTFVVGESKLKYYSGDYYCFCNEDGPIYVTREFVHGSLDKAKWKESKYDGGERYKIFAVDESVERLISTKQFVSRCLTRVN